MTVNYNNKLDKLNKKLDILIAIELAVNGLPRKEVADVLGVSEKTIERMIPFEKIKQKRVKTDNVKAETNNPKETDRKN